MCMLTTTPAAGGEGFFPLPHVSAPLGSVAAPAARRALDLVIAVVDTLNEMDAGVCPVLPGRDMSPSQFSCVSHVDSQANHLQGVVGDPLLGVAKDPLTRSRGVDLEEDAWRRS